MSRISFHEETPSYGTETESKTFTGAAFLVHALVSAGVTHVFGGHGGAVVPLIDEIEAHPAITWVYCRCEVNASQMAMAYSKLHEGKKLGCCIATSGPGAGHLLSGLVDADQDRVPVLCITGMKDSGHLRHADFQDIDQGSIFRMAGLAFSETVSHIDQLLPLTRNAVTMATTSNRCAHLAVPINIQQEEVEARTHFCLGETYQLGVAQPATRLEIDTLVMALRSEIESKRHVIIACGYRAHPFGEQIERIAELLHAPILTSYDGKGTVNERHPLAFGVVGVYGNAGTPSSVNVLDDCDTIISICCTDLTELVASKSGLQIRRLIQIDERLVAGDTMRFSPSTVFSSGFLKDSLKRVIGGLEQSMKAQCDKCNAEPVAAKRRITAIDMNRFQKRLTGIQLLDLNHLPTHQPTSCEDIWDEVKKESFVKPTGTPSTFLESECIAGDQSKLESTDYCHPALFFDIMKDSLESDAVVCADVGDNALWMASALAAKRGQAFLTSEHMGIMGMGLNAGLAASLASKRQTLVVAGDGGFQMSLNELATMRDHGSKNVLVVVIVNKRLGRVQNETWGPTLNADGCSIGSPDFVKLFDAYGYPNGMRLATCDTSTISETIDKGWKLAAENGCAIIELQQDPLVHPIMHKLPASSGQHKVRKSLASFEHVTRNPEHEDLFPGIEIEPWSAETRTTLINWVNSLSQVEKSKAFWFDDFDFIGLSLSQIIQDQLDSLADKMPGGKAPSLFPSAAAAEDFDSQFKGSLFNTFPTSVAKELISQGTQNNHPMCLQLLACPKDFKFAPHAHPNAELDIPLVGDLWERRSIGVPVPASALRRERTTGGSDGKFYSTPTALDLEKINAQLKQPGVCQFLTDESKQSFDRAARQGQVLYNPVGSIHQSYTKENGCLIFVLWSGVHANFDRA